MPEPQPRRDEKNVPWCQIICKQFTVTQENSCKLSGYPYRCMHGANAICLPAIEADQERLKALEKWARIGKEHHAKILRETGMG